MSTFKKFLVGAVALVAFFGIASGANAAYTHTGLLKMGMTSSQVMSLQQTLNSGGFLISTTGAGSPGMESMYFGAKTKAAVMSFQMAKGLGADGVVGLQTGTALAAMTGGSVPYPAGCSSTSGYSTTTGQPCSSSANLPAGCMSTSGFSSTTGAACNGNGGGSVSTGALAGTDGSISDVKKISSYDNEEVGEGENDAKVLGFEVEASNDGDIALKSLKLVFNDKQGSGSTRIDDYVDTVSVWAGSDKVGTADATDFNKDSTGVYSKTITLNSPIVRADKKVNFYVSVNAVDNFDSTDIAATPFDWNIDLANIRYQDGSGVVTTEDTEGDLPVEDTGINFVSFSTAADTELKISKDSDSPKAGIVIVDDSDETNDVVLLTGKIKLDGTSDVNIDSFPVTFTVAGGDVLSDIASNLTLVLDGEEYSESSATAAGTTSATITFDNLDYDLSAGDTISYEIRADINGSDEFNAGSSITASITKNNRDAMDTENEEGDALTESDRTGTAVGEAQEFRSEGISVSLISVDEEKDPNDSNLGSYTIKFKVAAVGDDVYVGTTATGKYSVSLADGSGTATTTGYSSAISNSGGSGNSTIKTSGGNWKINDGTSVTLTLQVFANSVTAGAYRAALSGIYWSTDDTDAVTTTDNNYTSNLDDFKTDYLQLL